MKNGYLKDYFKGIAVKKLSVVEADQLKSNQHEYNGDKGLRNLFGTENDRRQFITNFIYMNDDEVITAQGSMTWYDARENHPTRTEWRLYFPTTEVSLRAVAGDTLFICYRPDETVLVIITQNGTSIESQLYWLFDITIQNDVRFQVKQEFISDQEQVEFVSGIILEQIGIALIYESEDYLEEMLRLFGGSFPSTKEFSQFARSTIRESEPIYAPDETLLNWINQEEMLFRTLERHMIANRLEEGFVNHRVVDVDGFIRFSLSVQNRRKSRMGQALENHTEELFKQNRILYARTPVTENRSKPDFIFPSIEAYHDNTHTESNLTMLGVKSTCKDRWRQVLAEANRIEKKHLLTLEAAISENQTNEMKAKDLQLVLPKRLHNTYTNLQQKWLFSVGEFIDEVKEKQLKS